MSPLEEWDPKPAVISWIKKKEYSKARQQRWYKGIFTEAEMGSYNEAINLQLF